MKCWVSSSSLQHPSHNTIPPPTTGCQAPAVTNGSLQPTGWRKFGYPLESPFVGRYPTAATAQILSWIPLSLSLSLTHRHTHTHTKRDLWISKRVWRFIEMCLRDDAAPESRWSESKENLWFFIAHRFCTWSCLFLSKICQKLQTNGYKVFSSVRG
jgi:hypothetical protein